MIIKILANNIMNLSPPELKVTPEDLLYEVMDGLNEAELKLLMKDIQEEIELRKYKADRVKKMKQDLDKEFEKMIKKNTEKINAKKSIIDSSDEEDTEDEKPMKKPRGRPKKS
jgi:hypothetical protein